MIAAPLNGAVEWTKVNVNSTGFFRTLYTPAMWAALKGAIASRTLDVCYASHACVSGVTAGAHGIVSYRIVGVWLVQTKDRAMLIADAFALSYAEYMPVPTALDLAQALEHETEYIVWVLTVRSLGELDMLLAEKPAYGSYRVRAGRGNPSPSFCLSLGSDRGLMGGANTEHRRMCGR